MKKKERGGAASPAPEGAPDAAANPYPPGAVPSMGGRELVLRKEESGSFLFDPETSDLSCLNHVGSAVWEMIDGKRTVGEIAAGIAAKFEDAGLETVMKDVSAFLGDLSRMGYVTVDEKKR